MATVEEILGRLAPTRSIDFSEFGEIETVTLSRYQKVAGAFLSRNWVTIPHVTHNDMLDVSSIETRRSDWNSHNSVKITPIIPLLKALASALSSFPQFNASLSEDGNSLILKKFVNIGVAVDTPQGLLVPVLRDCGTKPMTLLAQELTAIAEKARGKGLSMGEMSGSSISLSSLGHIGGTAFTPIINAPDVAILGVTRTQMVAHPGVDEKVDWRPMLPVSLSYDHRVINGADAARFVRFLEQAMEAMTIA